MRTITDRPFHKLVTRMRVLNGKIRDAAVNSSARKASPLAVRKPAYHDAKPIRSLPLSRHNNGPARRSYMRRATIFGDNGVCAFCVTPAPTGATVAASARGAARLPITNATAKQPAIRCTVLGPPTAIREIELKQATPYRA